MNKRDFIMWLLGFVYNKSELQSYELDILRDKIESVLLDDSDDHK